MFDFLNSVYTAPGQVSLFAKLTAAAWTQIVAGVALFSALGYGWRIWRRYVSTSVQDIFLAWGLGVAACGFISALLSHTGLLQKWVVFAFAVPGLVMCWQDRRDFQQAWRFPTLRGWSKAAAILTALFIFTRFAESTVPNGQGDPLYYHVAAPYYWAKAQGFVFMDWSPWMFQGGLLEYLYAALSSWAGPPMAALISCQIVHAFCGVVLAPLICRQIAMQVTNNEGISWVAVLAFVTIPGDPLVLVRAKNDGLVLLMSIAATLVFVRRLRPSNEIGNVHWFTLFAWFAALGIAAKHSAVFLLAPLSLAALMLVATEPARLRKIATGGAVVLLAGLWPMARNYIYTGNPVFPAMDSVFTSPLINDAIRHEFTSMTKGNPEFFPALWAQFRAMYLIKPLYLLSVGALFIGGNPVARILSATALSALPLMALLMGDSTSSPRLSLALWSLISVSAVSLLLQTCQRVLAKRAISVTAAVGMVLGLINGKFEIAPVRFFKDVLPYHLSTESSWNYLAAQKAEMPVIGWLNENVEDGHVLSDNICESLFLNIKLSQGWNNRTANRVLATRGVEEFYRDFRAAGYTHYLHDKRNRPERSPAFIDTIGQYFEISFETDKLRLYQPITVSASDAPGSAGAGGDF